MRNAAVWTNHWANQKKKKKKEKETPPVNFLKILYKFEALRFRFLFNFYCFSLRIYHYRFRHDLGTIQWKEMDAEQFIRVFRI